MARWGSWNLITWILDPGGIGISINAVIEVWVEIGGGVTLMAETYSSSTLTILH